MHCLVVIKDSGDYERLAHRCSEQEVYHHCQIMASNNP